MIANKYIYDGFAKSPAPFVDYLLISGSKSKQLLSLDKCFSHKQLDKDTFLYASCPINSHIIFSGYAFYGDKLYDMSNINELVSKLGCSEQLLYLAGHFTFLDCSDPGKILAGGDYFGQGTFLIYSDNEIRIVTNRIHLAYIAISLLELDIKFNMNYIDTLVVNRYPFDDQSFNNDTVISGLRLTDIDEYLYVCRDGVCSNDKGSIYNYGNALYEQLIAQGARELTDNIAAIANYKNYETIIVDLSGGKDSRLMLAACMNVPEMQNKMRIRTESGLKSDLDAALAICAHYNLKFDSTTQQDLTYLSMRQGLNIFRSFKSGLYYHLPPVFSGALSALGSSATVCRLRGNCGEFYRDCIWDRFPSDRAQILEEFFIATIMESSDLKYYDTQKRETVLAYVLDSLGKFRNMRLSRARQSYYEWSRARKHYGLTRYDAFSSEVSFFPLLSLNALLATQLAGDDDNLNSRVEYDLINALMPELNSFDYFSEWNYAKEKRAYEIRINPNKIAAVKETYHQANAAKFNSRKERMRNNPLTIAENERIIFFDLCAEAAYRIWNKYPELQTTLFTFGCILYKYYLENPKYFRIAASKLLSLEDALFPLNSDRPIIPPSKYYIFRYPLQEIVVINRPQDVCITIKLLAGFDTDQYTYALYVKEGNKIINKIPYQDTNSFELKIQNTSSMSFVGFAKLRDFNHVYFIDSNNAFK